MKLTYPLALMFAAITANQARAQDDTPVWAQPRAQATYDVTCFTRGKEVFKGYGLVQFPRNGGVKIKQPNGNELLLKTADACNVKRKS